MTTKYTFKQEYSGFTGFSESTPPSTITMEVNGDLNLPQILERFEEFLRGAGFYFDGHLDFVYDDEIPKDYNVNGDADLDLNISTDNMGSTTVTTSTTYTMGDQSLTLPEQHSTYYYDYSRNK